VFDQSVRSDMNWQELASGEKAELVKHWQRLGQFLCRPPCHRGGQPQEDLDAPTALREKGEDKVVVGLRRSAEIATWPE
jgi:alpha-amylase